MSYVKNNQKSASFTSVNRFIQLKRYNGLSVIPAYGPGPSGTAEKDGSEVAGFGRQSGIIQRNSTPASVYGAVATAGSKPVIDSPKPGIHKTGFIDNDDGANIRTRPAESGGKTLTAQPLPPATRVFVGGRHPETPQWWYVNAYFSDCIVRGYVQNFRIVTELPEPGAKLYQVKPNDTVEKLARREFASGVRDGHDLRYYENVLLYVNRQAARDGIDGMFQNPNLWGGGSNNIKLVVGKRIWLVSPDFAKQLENIVPSGSFSGGAVAKAGRIYGHIRDIVQSITDSPKYFWEVAGEYAEVIYEHLPEIIATVAGFVLAESVSASLAASPTGVGQLAAVLIQLILALLGVQAIVESLGEVVDHAGKWLREAWAAEGNPRKLGEASKEFLHMLVGIAIAALSVLGTKANVGKGLKISNAIRIEPPGLGFSPALATDTGMVLGGGVRFYPGSVTSTGPVDIGIYSSMAAGPGTGVSDAIKSESKTPRVKDKTVLKSKLRTAADIRGKTDGGPGVWEKSSKRPKGVEYQEQISGVERGNEYKVEEVMFDGYDSKRKILLDAKDWERWPPADRDFWNKNTLNEAIRQVKAAKGISIEWHVSTIEKATILKRFLRENNILQINIIYTPKL
jgi:hypothetical protein